MLFLGIDTSAYTTSAALADEFGRQVWDERYLLPVKPGERGLMQSTAFFEHGRRLPVLWRSLPRDKWRRIAAVGVSTKPRSAPDSYMPVFMAGYGAAVAIAAALGVSLVETSHQEGHLAAGLGSGPAAALTEFRAFHLSGGTTELLRVRRYEAGRFATEIIGQAEDLHAGQFVDRVGVALGLAFPAGAALERLAGAAVPEAAALIPAAVKGCGVSFSGPESAARRLIQTGRPPADVALAVEACIVRSLVKMLRRTPEGETGDLLMVGGVASNSYLRAELERRLPGIIFHWAPPELSRDNAVGVARLAAWRRNGDISLDTSKY
ncbi:MAG: O-sialoglycoprotein endopeptidase [Gracilibacteraceae bacterium]|jgi:N6-L-threonylcarbamoyladenine synthase|nr:O-sialoglycoprotein endopeptidase [Gracilibacteraceae bacterium]